MAAVGGSTLAVQLSRPVAAQAGAARSPRRAVPPADAFYLTPTSGDPVVVPIPPMETGHSGYGPDWGTASRGSGRKPLLLPGDDKLEVWTGTLLVAYWSKDLSIEPVLNALRDLNTSRQRVAVHYGPAERGAWRVTGFSISASWRNALLQRTRATVDLELTEASDPDVQIRGPQTTVIYTTVVGDTLSKVSKRFYGSTAYVRKIMAAQHPRMRSAKLRPRQKLTIPPL